MAVKIESWKAKIFSVVSKSIGPLNFSIKKTRRKDFQLRLCSCMQILVLRLLKFLTFSVDVYLSVK